MGFSVTTFTTNEQLMTALRSATPSDIGFIMYVYQSILIVDLGCSPGLLCDWTLTAGRR